MDLKDAFAVHFAAALAQRIERADVVASRAYDLADALLRERARRVAAVDTDDVSLADLSGPDDVEEMPDDEFFRASAGLLDEPAPWSDAEGVELDASWLDRQNDPQWELEPKLAMDPIPAAPQDARPETAPGASDKPGLARTAPQVVAPDQKRRPA